jgi:hypothetical protein
MTLPPALAPLGAYKQFITHNVDKVPTDWRTGMPCNPHDPEVWTDYLTAYLAGDGRVGFVLTANDPFWCLDVDHCAVDGAWSALALEIRAMLPSCALEVSQSGQGWHLWGSGAIPAHASRGPSGSGLELYHDKRYIALGLPGSMGDASVTEPRIGEVIRRWFAPSSADVTPTAWTTAPVAEWNGPVDDDDLIRRACNSKSSAGAFGGKATFADMWDAVTPALCRAWPEDARGYDHSAPDAALAQHLAFWTGKNCERMRNLMLRSKLVRDKWDRDDYLPRTILNAVGQQRDVCRDKRPTPVADSDEQTDRYLHPAAQVELFKGCTYISGSNHILTPGGHTFDKARFDVMYGGYTFVLDATNGKTTRSAWECYTQSQAYNFPRANFGEFKPTKAPGEMWESGNSDYVNTYVPINTPRASGDASPFLQHIGRLLPDANDRAILLAYMAAVVQHPGVKFQWCPVIQGCEGNGKTLLSRCLTSAIGREHSHTAKPMELASRFNDWLENRIFIAVEDIFNSDKHTEIIESLTAMITNDWLEIEGKGTAKTGRAVCANFLITCNPKDAVRKTINGRKFAIFFTNQQSESDIVRDGMGGEYFPDLYRWLNADGFAIVNDFLRSYAIPDALNPAVNCHRAPITSSTGAAIEESAGRVEQEIINAIEQDQVGFRGGWISSHYLDLLLREVGGDRQYPRNKRKDMLEGLGYKPHPGLAKGRVNNPVGPEAAKSTLYVKPDHRTRSMAGPEVGRAYTADQEDRLLRAVG